VLSVINLVSLGFAIGAAEPGHAALHAGLALAFGVWARRLRPARPAGGDVPAQLEALHGEVDTLRRELSEAQERLDFAERLLAQGPEARRVGPQR
jgi:hypothetical protein